MLKSTSEPGDGSIDLRCNRSRIPRASRSLIAAHEDYPARD